MKTIVTIATMLFIVLSVNAQEHEKNKFVIGAGGGPGLVLISHKTTEFGPDITEPIEKKELYVAPGIAANIRAGYAPSEYFYVCFNIRLTLMQAPEFYPEYERETLVEGTMGLGVSFYPFKNNPRFFINTQYGFSDIGTYTETSFDSHFGAGITAGAGYHITRHTTVELDLLIGNSEMWVGGGETWGPCMANITVNFLNF